MLDATLKAYLGRQVNMKLRGLKLLIEQLREH